MKRALISLCIVIGILTLIEFIIPGHFNLLMEYFSGIGKLFTATYGEPTLPTVPAP